MKNSGVLLLFFDMPSVTSEQRKKYRIFLKNIKSKGFVRLQQSVYVKLQRTTRSTSGDIADIKRHLPGNGNVMLLPLTVGDFIKIIPLSGQLFDVSFFCDDFIVID